MVWTVMIACAGLGRAQQPVADQSEIKEIRTQMDQLQAQLDVLRRRLDELTSRAAPTTAAATVVSTAHQPAVTAKLSQTKEAAAQPATSSFRYDENGLSFQSSDGRFAWRSVIGLQAQFTGFGGNARENTSFSIRRMRPEFVGTVFKDFRYAFSFDLTGGSAALQNAYVDYTRLAKVTYLRLGQFKTPFGREAYDYSRLTIPFIERSNVASMTTARNLGLGFGGVVAKRLKWDAALLNGNGINGAAALNDNDSLEFAGHATVNVTKKLAVGGSVGVGNDPLNARGADTSTTVATDGLFIFGGPLPATTIPQGTTSTQGRRTRAGGDFHLDFLAANRPGFVQAEYIREVRERKDIPLGTSFAPTLPDLVRQGFYVQGGLFVTGGETRGLELLARFDTVDVDDKRDLGLAAAHPITPEQLFGNPFNILGNRMNTVTLGANYYFGRRTRFQLNYYIQDLERATTPGGGVGLSRRGISSFVQFQLQTVF
jgi:phosphate-selective porin